MGLWTETVKALLRLNLWSFARWKQTLHRTYSTHNLTTIKNWRYEVLEVEKVAIFKTYLTRKKLKVWGTNMVFVIFFCHLSQSRRAQIMQVNMVVLYRRTHEMAMSPFKWR